MCGSQHRFSPFPSGAGGQGLSTPPPPGADPRLSSPPLRRGWEALTATPAMASGRAEAAAPRVAELEEELRGLEEQLSRCQVPESGAVPSGRGGEGQPGGARRGWGRAGPSVRPSRPPGGRSCPQLGSAASREVASRFRRTRRATAGSGAPGARSVWGGKAGRPPWRVPGRGGGIRLSIRPACEGGAAPTCCAAAASPSPARRTRGRCAATAP